MVDYFQHFTTHISKLRKPLLNPNYSLIPSGKLFIPNSVSHNTILPNVLVLHPRANDFVPTQENSSVSDFISNYNILVILVFLFQLINYLHFQVFLWYRSSSVIFILSILVLSFLDITGSGKHYADEVAPKERIRKQKFDNPSKLIIGHLNNNSIRNKFECLREIIDNNIDILLISETEWKDTFPIGQFAMNSFRTAFRGVTSYHIYTGIYTQQRAHGHFRIHI